MTDVEKYTLAVGDRVMWRGTRVAPYFGRVLVTLPEEIFVVREEGGSIFWCPYSEVEVFNGKD